MIPVRSMRPVIDHPFYPSIVYAAHGSLAPGWLGQGGRNLLSLSRNVKMHA